MSKENRFAELTNRYEGVYVKICAEVSAGCPCPQTRWIQLVTKYEESDVTFEDFDPYAEKEAAVVKTRIIRTRIVSAPDQAYRQERAGWNVGDRTGIHVDAPFTPTGVKAEAYFDAYPPNAFAGSPTVSAVIYDAPGLYASKFFAAGGRSDPGSGYGAQYDAGQVFYSCLICPNAQSFRGTPLGVVLAYVSWGFWVKQIDQDEFKVSLLSPFAKCGPPPEFERALYYWNGLKDTADPGVFGSHIDRPRFAASLATESQTRERLRWGPTLKEAVENYDQLMKLVGHTGK